MAVTLRQVEKFSVSFASGNSSKTYTLSTTLLDTAKAFLVFGVRDAANEPNRSLIRGQITNTTTVTFNRDGSGAVADVVGYVVEFTAGVTVERGTATAVGAAGTDITLTSITDIADSFHFISIEAVGTSYGDNDAAVSYLFDDGSRKLHLEANRDSVAAVNWQVIQYDDCSVQRGSTSMDNGASSATGAPSAVDLAKTWLRFSYRHESGNVQNIGQKLLRGRFTSTTEITFDRDNTGTTIDDIRWETIEFTGNETVEEILSSFVSTDGQNDETVSAVSELTKAIVLASAYQRGGKGTYSADDIVGESRYTLDLTTTTNLQIKRASTNGTADVAAYVIDFDATEEEVETALLLQPIPRWDRKMRVY